jgi:polysaccharide export outer membrane protein
MGKNLKVQMNNLYLNKCTNIYLIMNKLFLLLILLALSSCYTSKEINYLQSEKDLMSIPLKKTQYYVQPHDVLNIKVKSKDPEQSAFFNLTTPQDRNVEPNPASLFVNGYPVTDDGMINMTTIGEVKVVGLTVDEIRDLIQTEIDKYLINAMVLVKLTSFKVSVLGDVKNPGTNYVYNTQSTIFEALSAAGDLNLSADRKKVKLIRQKGDASIVVNLDLTSPEIINSKYYFLHPNDVLYVDTSKQNLNKNNIQSNLGVYSLILSAVSTTILVASFISN